jgi:hypothetical protein
MQLSATDQLRLDQLVEEIDSFFERYEQQQRRDEERREEQRRRDEERREEDKRFWNEEVRPVLRARLSPAEQRVLVELLALLD